MENFSTKVPLSSPPFQLNPNEPLLFVGSCFSENIGFDLRDKKFPVVVNPFGITYNPLSALQQLLVIQSTLRYGTDDLEKNDDLFFSFDHHGQFSNTQADFCLRNINRSLENSRKLKNPTVVLTFGTGWHWLHKKQNRVVNNCHKLPQQHFTRTLAELEELQAMWKAVRNAYPHTRFIVSVSPIRYDNPVDNQRGKSVLHLFCHWLETGGEALYFPAYEILHDELRDYRFYAEDLKHPSPVAIELIRKTFIKWIFSEAAQAQHRDLTELWKKLQHRPLHPDTQSAKAFLQKTTESLMELQLRYPDLNWQSENAALGRLTDYYPKG
ncbi:MAG: GSCFA domain-containing protein [Cryomorphaceae bacterium]|nr:GSCFA domain-containing protein [Cryomorphaceae bacterium]